MKSVNSRAAVAPAERAVGPIAGGSTGCSDGSTACDELCGTVGLGAEMASGETSIRRIVGEIGKRKHQRKVGKGLKHEIRGSKAQIAHQIERSNEIHKGYFFVNFRNWYGKEKFWWKNG